MAIYRVTRASDSTAEHILAMKPTNNSFKPETAVKEADAIAMFLLELPAQTRKAVLNRIEFIEQKFADVEVDIGDLSNCFQEKAQLCEVKYHE